MERIPDYFDRTLILNLPERTDRLRLVKREFLGIGIAVDRPLDRVSVLSGIRYKDAGGYQSIGARGSIASHLAAIELARSRHLRNVLICEDDIKFTNVPTSQIAEIIAQIPKTDWDIIYFGYLLPKQLDKPVGIHRWHTPTMGGHYYAVNAPFFDTLIEFIKGCQSRPHGHPLGGSMGRDATFGHLMLMRPETKIFISSPNLAIQRSSSSDISRSRWFLDRTKLAPVMSAVRDWRERITS